MVFNESKFMLMLEGDQFSGVLLVADYLPGPESLTFELGQEDFGTRIRTFIINATEMRGQKLRLSVCSDRAVEVRVYYFTLNKEKEGQGNFSLGKREREVLRGLHSGLDNRNRQRLHRHGDRKGRPSGRRAEQVHGLPYHRGTAGGGYLPGGAA